MNFLIEDVLNSNKEQEFIPDIVHNKTKKTRCEIPIKFCDYGISNIEKKMFVSVTKDVSSEYMIFSSPIKFKRGTIIRVWLAIPDYWGMRLKKIDYKNTVQMNFFQIISRVSKIEPHFERTRESFLTCENMYIDPIDKEILAEYLRS